MNVRAINHVQLAFPAQLEGQIRRFYGRLIGLTELLYPAGATLRFVVGGQRLDLVPVPGNTPVPESAHLAHLAHLALEVQDLPRLRTRLLQEAVVLDESRPLPGYQRFYVADPAGNRLEFLELDSATGLKP